MDDDEADPFAEAEAAEREFRASRRAAAAGDRDGPRGPDDPRRVFGGGGGGGLHEPPRDESFAHSGHATGADTAGGSRGPFGRADPAASGLARRDGGVSASQPPPPRGVPGVFGSTPRDAFPDARAARPNAYGASASASIGRSREGGGARAPPLPPGAPPGAPRRPGPPSAPAPADERDVERDLFQAELERVVAEQEAERRRRENPGNPAGNPGRRLDGFDANARATGAPFAAGGGERLNAQKSELAGSALVSHPPAPPAPPAPAPPPHSAPRGLGPSGGGPHGDFETARAARLPPHERPAATGSDFDWGAHEDAETLKERKKRGGRRVREAEERRAAKALENATTPSALNGSFYPDAAPRSDRGGGPGAGGAPPGPGPSVAAGGWGAGALGGLAWAGPIAEIQRSASSDALAHAARARLASDREELPGRADAAAAMSSAAAAAAAAAAHHHQAAAASNAFAYESAIAALGALVDRRPAGGASGPSAAVESSRDPRGGDPHPRHHTPGVSGVSGVSVPRPAFSPGQGARSAGAPIGSVGLGFGGGLWSAAGPPLPPGPPPPARAGAGAHGGVAHSPGGAAATLVAAAALEDD